MPAEILIEGKSHERTQGSRSWVAGAVLGRGGQGLVYAARERQLDEARDVADLAKAIDRLRAVREAGEEIHGNLAAAMRKFIATDVAEHHVLKVYVPREGDDGKQATRRSEEETRVLSRVSHPNVIRIDDAGALADGRRWVVFPRCKRGSLVAARGEFTGKPLRCLEAALDVLNGVVTLHAQGFIHRDIKPENVLVADDGHMVLSDFGLVFDREREESLSIDGERIGNWQFGPDWGYLDEQHQHDPRVDIYAVAKVLWWLCSGRPVLRREDWAEPAFDLTKLHAGVAGTSLINDLLRRGLASSPERMGYATSAEMRAEVAATIDELKSRRVVSGHAPRACFACQTGSYVGAPDALLGAVPLARVGSLETYRCDACGHVVWFARPTSHHSTPTDGASDVGAGGRLAPQQEPLPAFLFPSPPDDPSPIENWHEEADREIHRRSAEAARIYRNEWTKQRLGGTPSLTADKLRDLRRTAVWFDFRRRLELLRGQLLECDQSHRRSEPRFWKVHNHTEDFLRRALGESAKERFRRARDDDHLHVKPLSYGGDHALDFMCHAHARVLQELRDRTRLEDLNPELEIPPVPEFDA